MLDPFFFFFLVITSSVLTLTRLCVKHKKKESKPSFCLLI